MNLLIKKGGFLLFLILSLLGTIKALIQENPGHYRVFTRAAHVLWESQNPQGTDFGTGVGYWFYSPSCGLYFFKFFDLFPEKIGLALYIILSVTVLVIGIERFLNVLAKEASVPIFREKQSLIHEITFLTLSPIILLGLTATKPEIIMTGILLLCCSYLIEKKTTWMISAFLAMILIWKYQPLPSLGLLCLASVLSKKNFKFPLLLAIWSAFWLIAPLAILSPKLLIEIYSEIGTTLGTFVKVAWMNFDNIFSFIVHGLGLPLSYFGVQIITVSIALIFGLGLIYRILSDVDFKNSFPKMTLYSLSFGSLFTVTLSPLSQNNSYILLAPFLIYGISVAVQPKKDHVKWAFFTLNIILFLAYSDFIPYRLKDSFRSAGLKPFAIFSFGCLIFWNEMNGEYRMRSTSARIEVE